MAKRPGWCRGLAVAVGLGLVVSVATSAAAATPQRAKRTSARVRAAREAMTPRYKLDDTGSLVPDVRAEAAIIFSPESGKVLWEEHAQERRSIASITKVMTAVVFLEDNPDLDQIVTVTSQDTRSASTTFLRAKEKLSVLDVLHLTLIASDNAAARVLARLSHGGTAAFVQRMNEKAVELGLEQTSFADPSGLNADDMSSAYDLSRLIAYAAGDERISTIMQKADYQFRTSRRPVVIHNTNKLVGVLDVLAGKTGFISASGHCLVTLLRAPQGPSVAIVVLGAHSNLGRFWETRHLYNWLTTRAPGLLAGSPDSSHPSSR